MSNGFLPISKQDMIDEGIEQLDFVYVCGDAYVDHPSFGHAIIARLLRSAASWFFGISRQYGLHGKPLFGFKEKKSKGFLYTGWGDGKEA